MKKSLLSAALFLFTSLSLFAQDEESAAEQWGERNALWVILGVVIVIILIVVLVRRRKK